MIEAKQNIINNKQLDRIISYDDDWNQITIGDSRYYQQKSSDIYYPSVTYILSEGYPKGKYFENWLKQNGHNATLIAQESAERGSNVHKAIEEMLLGKKPVWINENGYSNYSIQEWLMILRFAEFWNTYKPTLIKSEYHIYSNYHKYAGTIDLIIEFNGEKWIIDIKTSNALHITHDLQLAAYNEAWNEHFYPINKNGILWLNANTRKSSNDPNKIQGRGWQLVTSDREQRDNMNIFLKVYDIFKLENPELKPISEKYPNTVELILN